MELGSVFLWALAFLAIAAALGKFKKTEPNQVLGAARPMNLEEAQPFLSQTGQILGDWKPGLLLPLYYNGSGNILTVGSVGTMKGAGVLIPNLLQSPVLFLIDWGGENTAVASKYWVEQGYSFQCVNPYGMHSGAPWNLPSSSYNFLDALDPLSPHFGAQAKLLADAMVTVTGQEIDPIWNERAQAGIKALLMHAKTQTKRDQDLLTVRRYLQSSPKEFGELMSDMISNKADPAIAGQAREWLQTLKNNPKAFSSVMFTMGSATSWLDYAPIRKTVTKSEIRFEDLKGFRDGKPLTGAVISVVVPIEYRGTHAAFMRVILASAIASFISGPRPGRKINVIIDEFPLLGKTDMITDGIATHRKYGIRYHLVVQSIAQLEALYGRQGPDLIASCCGVQQFLGGRGMTTPEYVSNLCGDKTVQAENVTVAHGPKGDSSTLSQNTRPLLAPDEVRQMGADRQIAFIDNLPPAFLKIRPYWERPELQGRFHPNPFFEGTPPLHRSWRWELLKGDVIRWWLRVPKVAPVPGQPAAPGLMWRGVRATFRAGGQLLSSAFRALSRQS